MNSNKNYTFDSDPLEEARNPLLMDNPTYPPSIFPVLTGVSDKVTIEAWNYGFNRSKLVSQHQRSIIPSLSCNRTDNGTGTESGGPSSSPSPPSSDNSLTQGAKAGAGVGVTVGVLCATIVIVLLVPRFQIRLYEFSKRRAISPPAENRNAVKIQEPEAQETLQEKPDDQIHQVEGQTIM
ncbi:hypothetical protein F4823DRAFT_559349 [Ustulina deusta]|nr:hypothetical protein F4823DRAFT_559349 [Ustulina deusta]